jgi:peptide deformylase
MTNRCVRVLDKKGKAVAIQVLLVGDPKLRIKSEEVSDVFDAAFQAECTQLKTSLDAFRAANGFGRGIAAPQIAIPKRLIALNLGQGTFVMINPVIMWRSEDTFTLWDDCMCFPDTLVKVRRHSSISVQFLDEHGQPQTWNHLAPAVSELLQHEIDHLDGVLATDLALDQQALISRAEFDAAPEKYRAQVDYVIAPTIT